MASLEDSIINSKEGDSPCEESLPQNPILETSAPLGDIDNEDTSTSSAHRSLDPPGPNTSLHVSETPQEEDERTLSTTERLQHLLFHHPPNNLHHENDNDDRNNDSSRWKFWRERLGSVFYTVWLLWKEDPWAWIQLAAWTTIPSTLILLVVVHLNSLVIMNGRVIMNTTMTTSATATTIMDDFIDTPPGTGVLELIEDDEDDYDRHCSWLPTLEQRIGDEPEGDPRFWIHNFVSMLWILITRLFLYDTVGILSQGAVCGEAAKLILGRPRLNPHQRIYPSLPLSRHLVYNLTLAGFGLFASKLIGYCFLFLVGLWVVLRLYLVVPLIVLEGKSPLQGLKGSWLWTEGLAAGGIAGNSLLWHFGTCHLWLLLIQSSVAHIINWFLMRGYHKHSHQTYGHLFSVRGTLVGSLPSLVFTPALALLQTVLYIRTRVKYDGLTLDKFRHQTNATLMDQRTSSNVEERQGLGPSTVFEPLLLRLDGENQTFLSTTSATSMPSDTLEVEREASIENGSNGITTTNAVSQETTT